VRVDGCRSRSALSGQDRGDRNRRESDLSRVSPEMQVTIASGEMYPKCGIAKWRQGRWQTKVDSAMLEPEIGCHVGRSFVDVEQPRLRRNREK